MGPRARPPPASADSRTRAPAHRAPREAGLGGSVRARHFFFGNRRGTDTGQLREQTGNRQGTDVGTDREQTNPGCSPRAWVLGNRRGTDSAPPSGADVKSSMLVLFCARADVKSSMHGTCCSLLHADVKSSNAWSSSLRAHLAHVWNCGFLGFLSVVGREGGKTTSTGSQEGAEGMHPDKPAHAMVRAGLELLGLRPAVEDEVNGPFLWPRLPPCLPRSPGPQELVLLQDYRSLASWAFCRGWLLLR